MLRTSIINIITKIGLAVPLLYVFLESFVDPQWIISYWPNLLSRHVNEGALVLITGLGALALVIWLFTNKFRFIAATSTLTVITAIILVNITDVRFLFEIVPVFCLSLGLAIRYYPRIRVIAETKITILDEHKELHEQTKNSATGEEDDNDHDQHLFVPGHK